MSNQDLPVAVIGAGPVGLAAAAHVMARGLATRVYEAGDSVGANVRDWEHVRLFSPWRFNTDGAAVALLREEGWQAPQGDVLPTGRELREQYLEPLAAVPRMREAIRTRTRVLSVARHGIDKVVSRGRETRPFALTVANGTGAPRVDLARAVIDASGTWQNPNPLGASGAPALGEGAHSSAIRYGVPDVLRRDRADYAGRRVLVVGGGHSAANVLIDLGQLSETDGALRVTWAVRAASLARLFGGGRADKLPARGQLGLEVERLAKAGRFDLVLSFAAQAVEDDASGVLVRGADDRVLGPFDRIIVATGQRPDLSLTRELRLDLDPWLEAPRVLAPLIDPNLHSCGTVPPHGYRELSHPEPDYFTVGIKSYGRAPTFLMATGYEQVRSIAARLAGDERAARDVRLVLPETGVCSAAPVTGEAEGCCGGPAPSQSDACCADDHAAKQAGEGGCGCGSARPEPALASACCKG